MMQYNRVGKTPFSVSAVGFGTCQLRLIPEQQAINTLKHGFDLGVNWVHTAPDYEGADVLIAQAIEESGQHVKVWSQGYGDMAHFEYLFEETCRTFKTSYLEMFGIACIDDRDYLGEPVWGAGGMIDFLRQKQEEGRLGGIFCTTHGAPDYVARLITSGYFDAVMLAYNPLGFHLLSYHPGEARTFENIGGNRGIIFPLAVQHQVGLLIMKPLAGGLLCESKAFPSHQRFSHESVKLTATDILRTILELPGVCAVVPGTACVEEADENARAGHQPFAHVPQLATDIEHACDDMRRSLCSRCGYCEALCSQSLPVSWLFRDAYISHYPSETFETIDQLQYFHLHPHHVATCSTCTHVSCHCPYGLDIPRQLIHIHKQMSGLRDQGLLPSTPDQLQNHIIKGIFTLQIVSYHIPKHLKRGQPGLCRFYLHNAGTTVWRRPTSRKDRTGVVLAVVEDGKLRQQVRLRHDVEPGARTHVAFEFTSWGRTGNAVLQFYLTTQSSRRLAADTTELLTASIPTTPAPRVPLITRCMRYWSQASA